MAWLLASGGGRHGTPPSHPPAMRIAHLGGASGGLFSKPDPLPWTSQQPGSSSAIDYLVSMISLKEAAAALPGGAQRDRIVEQADRSIAEFIDDICPPYRRWPRPGPWPWPGPPPWIAPLVSELVTVAHSFEEGTMRRELVSVAGQILERGFSGPG
jgi:hypothetical protein